MKIATASELRNHFSQIVTWIEDGESVEITKRGKPFARLLPVISRNSKKFQMPDIMTRLNQTFGNLSYSSKDLAHGLMISRKRQKSRQRV